MSSGNNLDFEEVISVWILMSATYSSSAVSRDGMAKGVLMVEGKEIT